MVYDDLVSLLDNFNDQELEIIAGIVLRMASVKSEKWSGKLNFGLLAKGGGFADAEVDRSEKIKFSRKRRVRSSGL